MASRNAGTTDAATPKGAAPDAARSGVEAAIIAAMDPDVDYEAMFGPFFAERLAKLLRDSGALRTQTANESGWLVERAGWSPPMWWGGDGSTWGWRVDANAGLRFARRADAAAFIDFHCLRGLAIATEHNWIAGSGSTSVAPEVSQPIREAK